MSEPIPLALAEAQERRARLMGAPISLADLALFDGMPAGLVLPALRVRNAGTMLDLQALKRPYLVKGLINEGDVAVLFGETGSGKTFLAALLGYSLTRGVGVFGRRIRQVPCLFVELESEASFEKRLYALQQEYGPEGGFNFLTDPVALLNNRPMLWALIAKIRELKARLLVIDTTSRAIAGADENSSETMSALVAAVDEIRAATGVCVLLIHHTGKDLSRGMRGHSSLVAAVDVVLEVSKVGEGDLRQIRVAKARDDAGGHIFGFRLTRVELGLDEDGDPISTCRVEPTDEVAGSPAARVAKLSKGTLQALGWLREALDDYGDPAPAYLPFGRVTTKERWIEVGKKRTSETSDDAVRRAILRAVTHLTVGKVIGVHAPHFWLIAR